MITIILQFIEHLFRSDAAVMANPLLLASALPAVMGLAETGIGAYKEGKTRKEMAKKQAAWNAENEAWYNNDYYGDYTKRLDVQNVLKQMRDEMDRQSKLDQSRQAVLGTTNEANLAAMDSRNNAISDTMGNIAASGQQFKDNAQNTYRNRKMKLEELDYNTLADQAQSNNDMMYNGISGLGKMDWASILSSNKKSAK